MSTSWRKSVIAAIVLAMASPLMAQLAKSKTTQRDDGVETASGVIVKVEPMTQIAASNPDKLTHRSVRLTINTAAVWRDWVRDQASVGPKSPSQAAADGNKSVATNGEPISAETVVLVEVTPETKVETRYRSATDELSEGTKRPENAARAESANDPADTSRPKAERRSAKPAPFKADDLKPGLFVEVTLRRHREQERATLVRVMRPVGGANIPASVEKPTEKSGEK